MMTRMDRAIATRALSLPSRFDQAAVPLPQEGVGLGSSGGDLAHDTFEVGVALAPPCGDTHQTAAVLVQDVNLVEDSEFRRS
jgi:hypothetical protein